MSTEDQLSQIKGFDKIKAFYDNNRRNVSIAAIALIVIAGGIYYYTNMLLPKKETQAQAELFPAERYFRMDSVDKALYGDGQTMGMIDIADQFGSTDAGKLANYYAGRLLMNRGEFEAAKEHLIKAKLKDNFLAAGAVILQGDCESELGNYENAAKLYMKAAEKRENDVTTPKALYKAAIAFEATAQFDKALKALKRIKDDYSESPNGENIDRFIAMVEAKIASQNN
ncbi:MAG: tetratricopeptide repeat protein [Bacteroidia bacterium]